MSKTNDTADQHRYIDPDDPIDYPPVLRITVMSLDETFEKAHEDLRDLDGPAEEATRGFASVDQARRFLTDRRIEVMKSIMAAPPESIRDLADRLDRNYSDVHGDVELLADHHIVYFVRDGSAKRPLIPYDEIKFDLTIRGDAEPASP
jgi:predicted transcriptional regulator